MAGNPKCYPLFTNPVWALAEAPKPLVLRVNHQVENDSRARPESETKGCAGAIQWRILVDTSASLKELGEEDLDMVSGGWGPLHFGKRHFGNLPLGNNFGLINFAYVGQTNIAIQIGVAIGGSVIQLIDQSNAIS